MNKPNTICRVCKKEYFCCSDRKSLNSWKAMACSPECFKEYMKRIHAARKPAAEQTILNTKESSPVEKPKTIKKKPAEEAGKLSRNAKP